MWLYYSNRKESDDIRLSVKIDLLQLLFFELLYFHTPCGGGGVSVSGNCNWSVSQKNHNSHNNWNNTKPSMLMIEFDLLSRPKISAITLMIEFISWVLPRPAKRACQNFYQARAYLGAPSPARLHRASRST